MGCGKTTIGKQLSKHLQYVFYDMDREIEKRVNMTIPDIFKTHGEVYFRQIETQLCQDITQLNHSIIATGGGVIQSPHNCNLLQQAGIIVWLKSSYEQSYRRIHKKPSKRPLVIQKSKNELLTLYKKRQAIYQSIANVTISTEHKRISDIPSEIISTIGLKPKIIKKKAP